MTDLINQGGEAFLFVFIIGGAIAMMVWMFLASPKKFLKELFKDFLKNLPEVLDEEKNKIYPNDKESKDGGKD